jgi:DNA repair exonuclease SbcCD ATPase subunit
MATTQVTPPAGEHGQAPPAGSAPGNGGITAEELERRLAAARQEEKAKLYPDIERAKAELKKKEQELADLKTALETAREGSQRAQTLEEKIAQMSTQIANQTTQFSKALDDALENQRKENEEQRRKDRLAAKREGLLKATSELIPEMVTGETPEELDASFERAKAKYKEIELAAAEKVRKELGAPLREALPHATEHGGGGSAGGGNTADVSGGLASWRKMPETEWQQKKDSIKETVFAEAGLPRKQR